MDPVEDPHIFHFRLLLIVCEIGKDVFKALFTSYLHAAGLSLKDFMELPQTKGITTELKHLGSLQKQQLDMLFPISGDEPEIHRFDIMLLYTLIRHLGPDRGEKIWGTQPVSSDTTVPALVERVRLFKDVISGTGTDPKMNKRAFDDNAENINKVFQELLKTIAPPTATLDIDDRFAGVGGLKAVEPRKEEGYLSLLSEWTAQAITERKQGRENHFRYLIIVCEIGKDVIKEVFTSYFRGSTLKEFLNDEYIQKIIDGLPKNVIDQHQYELLYPPTGHESDIEKMDITLLYRLIRNLGPDSHNTIWGVTYHPRITNTTVPADVERVRLYRNSLSHTNLHMDAKTFKDITKHLYGVYERLLNACSASPRAIEDMRERFDSAISEHLDTDGEERYRKLVKELKESIERQLNEVQSDVAEIKDTLGSRIELTKYVLDSFQESNEFDDFVETESYQRAKEILKERRCVVIVGSPGAGKTYAAKRIALAYRDEHPTSVVLKPDSSNDVKEWPYRRLECLLFLDDFCGKDGLLKGDLVDWKPSFEYLDLFVNEKKLSLLVTMKRAVLHELQENLTQYDTMREYFDESVCVTLSTSQVEKEKFVKKYLSSVDAHLAATIVKSPEANIVGFPFLCRLARKLPHEKIHRLFNETNGISLHIDDLIKAEHSSHVALVVALCQDGKIYNTQNHGSQNDTVTTIANKFKLESEASDVIKQCQHLTDHLFTKEPGHFNIIHDSVSGAVFRMFFQRSNVAAIDMSPLSYVTNCTDTNVFQLITQRFKKEINSKGEASVLEISQGCIWEKEDFFNGFFKDLTPDIKDAFLLSFCKTGNLRIVKLLHGNRLYVPLEHACRYGHKDIVDYFLSQGGISADQCKSLLLTACDNGRNELVDHLVTNHPMFKEVPMTDIVKKAASDCNADALAKLLGIELAQKNARSVVDLLAQESSLKLHTILHDAVAGYNAGTFKYLVEQGFRTCIDELTDDGETVLHCACSAGIMNITKYIMDNFGEDLRDKWTTSGRSCLHEATKGSLEVLEYLLETCKFVPDQKSQDGFSILHLACENKKLTMVRYLVDKYPSLLNTKDNHDKTCMFHAAASGDVDVFRYLVGKGICVTEVDCNGRTVLHESCLWGQLDMVEHLLSNYGILTDKTDSTGRSYLLDVIDRKHSSILNYVLNQGLDIFEYLNVHVFMQSATESKAEMVLNSLKEYKMTTAIHTFLEAAIRERKVEILKLALKCCPEAWESFRILEKGNIDDIDMVFLLTDMIKIYYEKLFGRE